MRNPQPEIERDFWDDARVENEARVNLEGGQMEL